MPYKLSATLKAHSLDVRAVASPSNHLVLSASRDGTAVSWTRPADTQSWSEASSFTPGGGYINAVTYVSPQENAHQGYIVTGGQDATINGYALGATDPEPVYSLLGHQENVCALYATSAGTIISGSWDKTARVWKNWALLHELVGHQQAVWAVLAADDTTYLTGSADKSIKIWNGHKVVKTLTGHTEAVRGLTFLPGSGFASCSNDSEIRIWTVEGVVLHVLSGHTSFVYSLAALPNGDVISGGEDRCVRIWRDGSCIQTIVHPAISVWCVSTMPNGDIVSGCSDGIVRVFSSSEDRWLSSDELKSYDDSIASQALPSQQIGDVKKDNLPTLDSLLEPGQKDGQVKMVRNNNTVEAHQWNSSAYQWQKVGEVVDAIGTNRRQLYEGKEYDYVFDVDIQDGVPPLKLPYNVNENPYTVAQQFLDKNDLPTTYLEQVVQFIEKNAAVAASAQASDEFVDPFTGASRYRASNQNTQRAGASAYSDPYTGASRYQATQAAPDSNAQASYSDPFTGSSRYQPSGASNPSAITPSRQSSNLGSARVSSLPVYKSLSFKQANISAMKSKFQTFSLELSTNSVARLTAEETAAFEEMFSALAGAVAAQSSTGISITNRHIRMITNALERWPSEKAFPVIDLARMVALYAPQALSPQLEMLNLCQALVQSAEWTSSWSSPVSKHRETNSLLLLRTLANCIGDRAVANDLIWLDEMLPILSAAPLSVLNKNSRTALATLLFNISTIAVKGGVTPALQVTSLNTLIAIIDNEREDSEVMYRAVVALGNIVYVNQKQPQILPGKNQLTGTLSAVSRFPEPRLSTVISDITTLLQ